MTTLRCYTHPQLIDTDKFSSIDLEKIGASRGIHNRLGFAYQLVFVRLFNYFPQQKPFAILAHILSFSALQLGFSKLQQLKHPAATPSAQALLALTRKLEIMQETKILEIDMIWIDMIWQVVLFNESIRMLETLDKKKIVC